MLNNKKTQPNPKQSKILSSKNGLDNFRSGFGMTTKCPTVFIKTFGCQMNVRDSEFVMGSFIDAGFGRASSAAEADIIIFNSCSVRKHAEDRLFSNICDLAGLKKEKPGLVVCLMGCAAQNYKASAFKKLPMVDIVCGPGDEPTLPSLVRDAIASRCHIVATDNVNRKRPEIVPGYRESKFKALVSISEGCDNYCAYCVVPYVRGSERSRGSAAIVREIRSLAERGFKEITLLGQNVNSYGKDHRLKTEDRRPAFVKLLEKLNRIEGIGRIRFMTSHPKDASIELFKSMRDLENICPHLHLPVQAGSDKVLKAMNRKYTAKKYLKLIEEYRKLVPGGAVTTDILVGFPGETAKDFEKTFKLSSEIGFDSAFVFKYSPRPPARSVKLKDSVTEEEKQERLARLLLLQRGISERRNKMAIGNTFEVLVDGTHKKENSKLTGRTKTNKIAVFRGDSGLVGSLVNVRIISATPHALIGDIEK